MKSLSIDIETYGSVDLTKSGVYAYANAPDFKILLFAYAFDDEEVKIIDLAQGEALPTEVMDALTDGDVLKTAYNANFERTCIGKYFNINLPVNQWRCSAVQASELGLPLSLSAVAVALGLEEQKDKRGKALIDYFSKQRRTADVQEIYRCTHPTSGKYSKNTAYRTLKWNVR